MKEPACFRVDIFELFSRLERCITIERWVGRSVFAPEVPVVVDLALDYKDIEAEAELSLHLDHPSIPPLGIGLSLAADDVPQMRLAYLVRSMPIGPRLPKLAVRAHSAKIAFPVATACWVGAQVARALHHCHEAANKPHGALTPGDIWLDRDGAARVTGFVGDPRDRPLSIRQMEYWSPEHVLGAPLDPRTDVFSLGVIIFELLTQRRLLKSNSVAELSCRLASDSLGAPSRWRPDLPAPVDELVCRALAPEPADRFESAAAFADALEAVVGADSSGPGTASFVRDLCVRDFERFDALFARMAAVPVGSKPEPGILLEDPGDLS